MSGNYFYLPHCPGTSSALDIEDAFYRILQRGCKAVGPEGPSSTTDWLLQAFIITSIIVMNPKGKISNKQNGCSLTIVSEVCNDEIPFLSLYQQSLMDVL